QTIVHEFYGGVVCYQEIKTPTDAIPLIIPLEIVRRAQSLFWATSKCRPRTNCHGYTSVLYCARCNHRLTIQAANGRPRWACGQRCGMSVISQRKLDKLVAQGLVKALRAEERALNKAANSSVPDKTESDRRGRLAKAKSQRDRALHLFTSGRIEEQELDELLAGVDSEILRLSVRTVVPSTERESINISDMLAEVATWAEWPAADKREFLLLVCPKIVVDARYREGVTLELHTNLPVGVVDVRL
ncbi:MAG: zinc ribbon domain-containing protein, partial [Armatimonadota bacterium]|nr:zinc ribbon domain-containing protein [Armatimonadota bacterium]